VSVEEFAKEQAYGEKANPSIFHHIPFLKRQDNTVGVIPVTGLFRPGWYIGCVG
jgi:hypothetical protein